MFANKYLFVIFLVEISLAIEAFGLNHEIKCNGNSSHHIQKRSYLNRICGESLYEPDITSLVVGGNQIKPGIWPWLAAMYHHSKFTCGGSIISERVILTAAHCIQDKGDDYPRLAEHSYFLVGKHSLESTYERDYKTLQILKFIMHPSWKGKTHNYDADIAIAVTILPIPFNHRIKPICLYPYTETVRDIVGKNGVVAGWGYTEEFKLAQNGPRIVELPVIDGDACVDTDSRLASIISNRCFCTAPNMKQGPCRGDSGGGLAIKINGKWWLRGIVSVTLSGSCSDFPKFPIVYTDVGQFSKWIQAIIENEKTNENQLTIIQQSIGTILLPAQSKIPENNYVHMPSNRNCGISNLKSFLVKKGDMPWIALESFEGEQYCVAYLISNRHMLLTANCVHSIARSIPKDYYFLIGQFDSESNEHTTVRMGVSRIVIHPDYIPNENENNLAIAFLKSSVASMPICLPARKSSLNFHSSAHYVIGWEPIFAHGRTSPIGKVKIVSGVVTSKQNCIRAYSKDVPVSTGRYFCMSHDRNIGKGPCDVDYDGSGVIIQEQHRWTLRGIKLLSVIGADDQCDPSRPVLFLDIVEYVDWITKTIN